MNYLTLPRLIRFTIPKSTTAPPKATNKVIGFSGASRKLVVPPVRKLNSQPPSIDPMQPTMTFQKMPMDASRFITLLASHPIMPPIINAIIKLIIYFLPTFRLREYSEKMIMYQICFIARYLSFHYKI